MKEQATQMLNDCRILEVLKPFGEIYVHGSYELDLMVWPEVDICILCPKLSSAVVWQALERIHEQVPCKSVFVLNQLEYEMQYAADNSVLVDCHIVHGDIEWKLDIGFWDSPMWPNESAGDYNTAILKKMTPELRDVLLEIKTQAVQSPHYRRAIWEYRKHSEFFYSDDIYRAVFDAGVRNYDAFAAYLNQKRNLQI